MTVSMKDIAKDLGISVVTVSKVLRHHPDIGEKTRKRVLKRAKELDYQPNVLARSLVTGRTYLIGLVVPDLLHPFFAEVAKALSTVVGQRGYSVIISSSEEDAELEAREIHQMVSRQLDALVIASSSNETAAFEKMDRQGQPYVLIDREIPGLVANFVGIDDEAAGRMATEHLADQGCRTIAHIRGKDNSTGMRRFEGYKQALQRRGLRLSDSNVAERPKVDIESRRHGAEAMRSLLKQRSRPDGVFCYNDPLAIGAMTAIVESGLRIPEDIAIIGCGNLHYDSELRVPLSSVDQHSQIIGERAAKIVLGTIESKVRPNARCVILDPSLVVRSSTLRKSQPVVSDIPPQLKAGSRKREVAPKRGNRKRT
jgi:LacI family transcriptional regulator